MGCGGLVGGMALVGGMWVSMSMVKISGWDRG